MQKFKKILGKKCTIDCNQFRKRLFLNLYANKELFGTFFLNECIKKYNSLSHFKKKLQQKKHNFTIIFKNYASNSKFITIG